MNFRGAGWILGPCITLIAFATVAACGDGDSGGGIALNLDSGVSFPDGGSGSDAAGGKDASPIDSGTDSSKPDASLPGQCNDNHLDIGETCDPLTSCPSECAPDGCNLNALQNAGTCAAVCTTVAVQTQCANNDACCPGGCTVATDNDCKAVCGNGALEPGEKCDGADCPTACPPVGCTVRKLMNGGTCQAECVDAQTPITTCGAVADGGGASDNCCPAGCVGLDPDCAAGACGNGILEPAVEKCDTGIASGAGSCPTTCAAQGCNLFRLNNPGTCQAECAPAGSIAQCANGDSCCAPGCDNTNDAECAPKCGNGVTEPPIETCDANCPKNCPQNVCQLFTLENAGTCTAACKPAGTQTQCIDGDGCCPPSCTNANDKDCPVNGATCGNGKLDTDLGETCDPSANVACPLCNTAIACVGQSGSAATCNVKCDVPITTCSGTFKADACCPLTATDGSTCNDHLDRDCHAKWLFESLQLSIVFTAAGECHDVVITNVEQGGSYDVTTCSPVPSAAQGDVLIRSVVGSTVIIQPPVPEPQSFMSTNIDYGNNDNCLSANALPSRAGWTCKNVDGAPTMSCVAEGTGGFITKNTSDLVVTICSVSSAARVPFSVWYNATAVPQLTLR